MPTTSLNRTAKFERALAESDTQLYVLRFCISGMTPRSREAMLNLNLTCETHLQGQYQLEIIDLYQQPELATKYEILATTTLRKPCRRLCGGLLGICRTRRRHCAALAWR